jgi:putative DNA primase/helicase
MTKMTSVSSKGECPRFLSFLDEVTGGDITLVDFLQRMFGYCITGSTREHALFFLYGTGANGKSVLLNTVAGILGDYHRTAPIETFTASAVDRHPTELACLQGRRLVTSIETEEGRRWAESRIKALTGGDKIAARYMRGDFFEYTPAFKLVIAGNHKPGLRTVDEAIRRRFHLVPFTVTIPEEKRDPELTDKLRDEWPGILAWMVEGALIWQEQGLRPPEAVTSATKAYLEAEDALSAWLEECCDRADPSAWETNSALFGSWRCWAEKAGEHPGTMKRFVQNLEARGLTWERTRTGRGFRGIRLDQPDQQQAYWER